MSKKPIIIGGGLSGLSACYHGDGIIYEKNDMAGGQARSHKSDNFIFDEGIHVMHTNNKYVLSLMEKLNVDMDIRDRSAWIVSHGKMTRYPFQANTYGLPVNIVKDCLLGFIENDFTDIEKINNYKDWIYYMFGKGIAEHFMIPYSKKFWGIDPEKLTTEWVNVRHPKPSTEEVITGALKEQTKGFGINAVYRYPRKNGFGYIGECLERECRNRINPGMEATNIDVDNREIEFNSDTIIPYETILSSMPLPELIKIIPKAPKEVMDATSRLKTNSMFVVNIGVNRANITDKNWIYFLEEEYSFIRISFPFNQSDHVTPSGMSSISAEIAYGNNNKLPVSKEKMGDYVVSELIDAKVLRQTDEIVYLKSIDIKYGYVIFDEERKPAVRKIHDYLKSIKIIPLGRYGMWAYLWSDEAILSGKKAAEKLIKLK